MAPPSFNDLSQAARSVLNVGYIFDIFKLEMKSNRHIGIRVSGLKHRITNAVITHLETRHVIKKSNYSIYLAETWNLNNVMTAEATIVGLFPGVKISAEGEFDRKKLLKGLKFTSDYKNDFVALNLKTEFGSLKPVIDASAVVAYNNWFGGIRVHHDTKVKILHSINLTFGYNGKFTSVTTAVNNNKVIGSSIFQKLSKKVDVGMLSSFSYANNNDSELAIGTRIRVKRDVILRAKFNNKFQLFLGTTIKLKRGISLTMSSLIECQHINDGRHTYGIGLTFEP